MTATPSLTPQQDSVRRALSSLPPASSARNEAVRRASLAAMLECAAIGDAGGTMAEQLLFIEDVCATLIDSECDSAAHSARAASQKGAGAEMHAHLVNTMLRRIGERIAARASGCADIPTATEAVAQHHPAGRA